MDDEEIYSKQFLERFSYRYLQQLAKSMSLPSNMKKIQLIDLIYAKKYKSQYEVTSIIQKLKIERQLMQQTQNHRKKRKLQVCLRKPQSPPITITPTRCIQCYDNNNNPTVHGTKSYSPPIVYSKAGRMLRSSRLKNIKCNEEGCYSRQNIRKCVVKKSRIVSMIQSNCLCEHIYKECAPPLVSVHNMNMSQSTIKNLSFNDQHMSDRYRPMQDINVNDLRKKMIEMLALLQPTICRENSAFNDNNNNSAEVNRHAISNHIPEAQNITHLRFMELASTDSNIDDNYMQSQSHNFPSTTNIQQGSHIILPNPINIAYETYSLNNHEKLGTEETRSYRHSNAFRPQIREEEQLPKIHEAFQGFKDYTQPLHIEINENTLSNHSASPQRNIVVSNMLEPLYNFKNQFLSNQPLLKIVKIAHTTSVFTGSLVMTPMVTPSSSTVSNDHHNASSSASDSRYNSNDSEIPTFSEYVNTSNQNKSHQQETEDRNTPNSLLDTLASAALGACVTVPEMVEDALVEMISQDGDYIDMMAVEEKVQCVLCSWAGPNVAFENHIRKEHAHEIHSENNSEWNVTYTLGSLVKRQAWLSKVIDYEDRLYVLSAKYENPECFMASLCTVNSNEYTSRRIGTITIYNKMTGEPFSWKGEIQSLPSNLTTQTDENCIKVDISQLDLLPNSANLKLVNGELVNNCLSKVIVGQPKLNFIIINLFVKVD